MASEIKSDKLSPSTGTALQIGDASDTITIPTGATFTVTDGIGVASGGTGLASFTAGDILYATGSTTLAKLAKGTAEQVLAMNSGATAPDWGSVDLTVLPTITVAKGGTNLSSFTAGDILYATGSTTLAKLAKGAATEVLAMNSGATAPEWATAGSGDCVRLWTIADAGSGTPSYWDMTSVFSSTYAFYKLYGNDLSSNGSNSLQTTFLVGGAEQTAGTYYRKHIFLYGAQASASTQDEAANTTEGFMPFGTWGTGTGDQYKANVEMTFFNPIDNSAYNEAFWHANANQGTSQMIAGTGSGYYTAAIAATGLRLQWNSGTWATGVWNLYGFKAS